MKLNAPQLGKQLKEELAPVYVVSGDDPLLCGEACDLIRQACRAAGSEERQVFDVDRSFDWAQLYEASHSLSLFAQKRLLELRLPSGKPGDAGAKALLAYLEQPAEDTTLLISLPKLDGSTQRSKWAKKSKKQVPHSLSPCMRNLLLIWGRQFWRPLAMCYDWE